MKVLLVWAAAPMSIRDVTTGIRGGLVRAGHKVRDYRLDYRLERMRKAFPDIEHDSPEVCRMATENVLAEATYHGADLVLIISGLLFHEIGLWLLDKFNVPTAVVLTESPYSDAAQKSWLDRYPNITVFTQERTSAARHGWHYLPCAYDQDVHKPVEANAAERCDVLFVGTGWPERQRLLEAVDWTGIDLKLRGLFPDMKPSSSLAKFYHEGFVDNADMPTLYASCKIALNPYRQGDGAESLNPRAYELAACGTLQLCDPRAETNELFKGAVPTYRDAAELEMLIRRYLSRPDERQSLADASRAFVQGQTFDRRVADIIAAVESRLAAA